MCSDENTHENISSYKKVILNNKILSDDNAYCNIMSNRQIKKNQEFKRKRKKKTSQGLIPLTDLVLLKFYQYNKKTKALSHLMSTIYHY